MLTTIPNRRDEIYRTYYPKVLGYARSHIKIGADAEDLASEVFLKVYEKFSSYDESKGSVSTWIYAITRNEVCSYFRRKRDVLSYDDAIGEIDASAAADYDALQGALADALGELPARQREAVILFYYHGLSHTEIAGKLGISYANARKICSQGVAELRKKLGRD